jgi:hypothetical protein
MTWIRKRQVARVTFSGRKNAHGEYVVRAYDQHGKRFAEADYFTNDKADAKATAQAMMQPRLEELRAELRAECISYGELAELQGLADYIKDGDVELLEAAGVPEEEARLAGRI